MSVVILQRQTPVSGVAGQTVSTTQETTAAASDDAQSQADTRWFLIALAMLASGIAGGTWLAGRAGGPVVEPNPVIDGFALFYILAQSLERAAELANFVPWVGTRIGSRGSKTKVETRKALNQAISSSFTAADDGAAKTARQQAANAAQDLKVIRNNRAAFFFGLNSAVAAIGAGYFNLLVLKTAGVTGAPEWLDIVITGLAIGGGTKPLHDLIKNIQKAKEEREDDAAKITVGA